MDYPYPACVMRLFDAAMPNAACAFGVLEGFMPGGVRVDDIENPTWAVGRMYWNMGFAAGKVDCEAAALARQFMARWGEFSIFRADGDPDIPGALKQIPRVEFYGPRRQLSPRMIPAGCQVVPMTIELLKRCQWGPGTACLWNGLRHFVNYALGFCLVRGDEILCEAPAFARGGGKLEISVITHADHRGKGYAHLTCRALAEACEARGIEPTYSCELKNAGSVATGRSLGFSFERSYRAVTYEKIEENAETDH